MQVPAMVAIRNSAEGVVPKAIKAKMQATTPIVSPTMRGRLISRHRFIHRLGGRFLAVSFSDSTWFFILFPRRDLESDGGLKFRVRPVAATSICLVDSLLTLAARLRQALGDYPGIRG